MPRGGETVNLQEISSQQPLLPAPRGTGTSYGVGRRRVRARATPMRQPWKASTVAVCIVCLVIFRADVAALSPTVLPDKNCPCLLEAHLCRRECASCLSCMSEPSRLSTDTAARYLSVEPWTFEDGFFDVARFWNFTHPLSPVPVRLPRARPVLSVVEYLRIAESDMIDTTVRIFRKMCADSEQRHGRDHVFVDSGSNEGTFSLLAAAHGCHAIAIDPQPMCLQHMVNGAAESSLNLTSMPTTPFFRPLAQFRWRTSPSCCSCLLTNATAPLSSRRMAMARSAMQRRLAGR